MNTINEGPVKKGGNNGPARTPPPPFAPAPRPTQSSNEASIKDALKEICNKESPDMKIPFMAGVHFTIKYLKEQGIL
jgi:hypothetical protein